MRNCLLYVRAMSRTTGILAMIISALYFGVLLHIPLYNAGGFGTDLPQNLLAWIMALIMIAGIWLCISWRRLKITTSFSLILAGVVLLNIPVLWTPHATWVQSRLPSLMGMWGAILLFFTLLQCRFSYKQRQWLLYIVAVSAAVEGCIVLLDIYAGGLPNTFTRALLDLNGRNAFGSFQQMNVTASFLATGLVISLLLLSVNGHEPSSVSKTRDSSLIIFLLLLSIALVILQSRTGWVGAFAGYIFVNVILLSRRASLSPSRRYLLWLCPLAGMLVGIILLQLPDAPNVDHNESNFQRWLTLSVTWKIIMTAPLQGWGIGSFGYIFQHWMAGLTGVNPSKELMLHPHNEILYQWMEGGIVALFGCVLIAAAGVGLIRRQSASHFPAGWVALLPVMLHTQTEFPLYYSAPHILVLILILVCVDTSKPRTVILRRYRFAQLAGRAGILLVCAYFIALLAWSLKVSFILSRYESQAPGAQAEMQVLDRVSWFYQSRYDYDKNTLLLAQFNATRDTALLSRFLMRNAEWMQGRISPDAAYNQSLVLHFLHRDEEGRRIFLQSRALFPWDKRFGNTPASVPSG